MVTPRYEVLGGLPSYGDAAVPFPQDSTAIFREGLVVRFHPKASASWVGNFERGLSDYDHVLDHPDGSQIVIIAGGQGYVIDAELRKLTHQMGFSIKFAITLPDMEQIVVGDDIQIGGIRADRTGWNSPRISWDGIRNIVVSGKILKGEAYSPLSDEWSPFTLDLETGECPDAIYVLEMRRAVPIRRE